MRFIRSAISGLALVGVAFGIARYGYGLFLPKFQDEFQMSPALQGTIASGSYGAYIFATALSSVLSTKYGPAYSIILGASSASIGMLMVASSEGPLFLAMGILLAGASPGFVFPALSDWSKLVAGDEGSDRLFSIMNSGTGAGVMLAAPFAIWFTQENWRDAWAIFSGIAFILGINAYLAVPSGKLSKDQPIKQFSISLVAKYKLVPLYLSAFNSGLVTSVYWTFSVKAIHDYGMRSIAGIAPEVVFWVVTGATGFAGALAGESVSRIGLEWTHRFVVMLIAISIMMFAFNYGLYYILVSGVFFGAAFIFITGILGVWAMRVFNETPAIGLGLTFLVFTFGAMLGPFLAGILVTYLGLGGMFVLFGVVAASSIFIKTSSFIAK